MKTLRPSSQASRWASASAQSTPQAAPSRFYSLVRGDYISYGAADVTAERLAFSGKLGMYCYKNTKHGRYSSFTTASRVYIMLGTQVVVSYPTS